jgi:enoyl-CoA hydratase
MEHTPIVLERDGPVATITVNRPQLLNALNQATLDELSQALVTCEHDNDVRVVLITGAGERAFVAGADINELRALASASEARLYAQGVHDRVGHFIADMHKPVIAVINGFALGGGCELALACDIRLAADTARLGLPEINLGIMPGWGGTQRLTRLVGPGAAKLIALSGDMIPAPRALEIGLVDGVYPAAELRHAAMTLARSLAAKAPLALVAIKQAINGGSAMSLRDACAYEAELFGALTQTADAKEGTGAFLEKRQPSWTGC